MGVIGSAKLLQALARDHLIPGLSPFSQGTKKSDDPIYAICITFLIAQITMFADINQIASFITMTVGLFLAYPPQCLATIALELHRARNSGQPKLVAICECSPIWDLREVTLYTSDSHMRYFEVYQPHLYGF
jgi:amino acid transporter